MKNVRLRPLEPSDADMIYQADTIEGGWIGGDLAAPYSLHNLRQYALGYDADPFSAGQLRLIAEEKDSNKPIGILDFYEISPLHSHAFIGILVLPRFRSQGFGNAIIKEAINYAEAHLNLDRLGARIIADNKISIHLFEKNGFLIRGNMPDWHFSNGSMHDLFIMSR